MNRLGYIDVLVVVEIMGGKYFEDICRSKILWTVLPTRKGCAWVCNQVCSCPGHFLGSYMVNWELTICSVLFYSGFLRHILRYNFKNPYYTLVRTPVFFEQIELPAKLPAKLLKLFLKIIKATSIKLELEQTTNKNNKQTTKPSMLITIGPKSS